ncbi:hypothetical protein [Streptomyces sp. NPDC002666]
MTAPVMEDGCIVLCWMVLNALQSSRTITPPAGWTLLDSGDSSAGSIQGALFYRVVMDAASEPSTYSFDFNGTVIAAAHMVSYSGVDPDFPISDHNGSAGAGTSVTVVTPSVVQGHDWGVYFAAVKDNATGGSFTNNRTERLDSAGGNATLSLYLSSADSPESSGAKTTTFTYSTSGPQGSVAAGVTLNPKGSNALSVGNVTYTDVRYMGKSEDFGTASTDTLVFAPVAGLRVGDLIIMNAGTNQATWSSIPTGWTETYRQNAPTDTFSDHVFIRIADENDVAASSFLFIASGGITAPIFGAMTFWRGVDPKQPVHFQAVSTQTNTTGGTTPSGTNTVPVFFFFTRVARNPNSTQITYSGAGYERWDGGNNGSVAYSGTFHDSGFLTAPGAGTGGLSMPGSATGSDCILRTIGITAAACPPAVTGPNPQAIVRAARW